MTEVRLRNVAQINPPSPAFDRASSNQSIVFLPMESIWPGRLDLSGRREKASVATGYTRFESGDVLVPKITPTFEASRSVLFPDVPGGVGVGTSELHVVRHSDRIDPRFLCYIFHSHDFLKVGESEMYGVAGQKRVPDEVIRNWRIDLPNVARQRVIADFLDCEQRNFDAIIDAFSVAQHALNERRIAGVFSLITGQSELDRKSSGLAWVATLPIGWRSVKLSYAARLGSGHTPSRARPEWWIDCVIPWVTTGEVFQMRSDRIEVLFDTREKISEIGVANSSAEIHPEGTVVLCRTAASAGYSAVMGTRMATSQDLATWTCGPELDPFYLLWCLRAMRSDLLGRLAFGSTHKTIYMPDLQSLRIPLPERSVQENIVTLIRQKNKEIDSCIDAIDTQVELLRERRQALITAAVTGQIDVTTARGIDA